MKRKGDGNITREQFYKGTRKQEGKKAREQDNKK